MQSHPAQRWVQQCLAYVLDQLSWSRLRTSNKPSSAPEVNAQAGIAASKFSSALPRRTPVMALGSSVSALARLDQPSTYFAIACISISLLALSTAWTNRKISSSRPSITRNGPFPRAHPDLITADEGYSSSGEEEAKKSRSKGPQPSASMLTRTATVLADCSKLLQTVNRFNVTHEDQANLVSSLSLELPASITALCQIQHLLGIYHDVLTDKTGLKSCYETVLSSLAHVTSALDRELASSLDYDRNDLTLQTLMQTSSKRHDKIEVLIRQLEDNRQSLMFVIDFAKRSIDTLSPSSSLMNPSPLNSKARTPGTELKALMDSSPDFDELPEYSPPTDGFMAPDVKTPLPHTVEVDSPPVHMRPNRSVAVTTAVLFVAIAEDDSAELEALLSTGFDPNSSHGQLRRTALHECARLNRSSCAKVLSQRGALTDVDDAKGDTPMHIASWEGHVEVVSALLAVGADIDRISGRDGYSPLWCAITAHHIDLVRLLIRHGARISLKSPADAMPLHQAAITGQSAVAQLLITGGAHVNCVDQEKNTPLHYAATIGDVRTAEILIREGANLNAKQDRGLTPLHWACHKGHDQMVKFLIASGADVDALSETYATPLHCSAARGHLACVKLLVRKGADCKVVTAGWDGVVGTAREVAVRKGFDGVASFIADYRGKRR